MMVKFEIRNPKFENNNQQGVGGLVLLIVVGILIAAGAAAVSYSVLNRPAATTPQEATPAPTAVPEASANPLQVQMFNPILPTAGKISEYQRVIIGQTTEDTVAKMPDLIAKESSADGSTKYSFKSPLTRPSSVVTKDGKAVFDQEVTVNPTTLVHPKLKDFLRIYGAAESTIQGSAYFGPFEKIYIWGSKGITVTANPNTDEISEIQVYAPVKPSDYVSMWGADAQPGDGAIHDGF